MRSIAAAILLGIVSLCCAVTASELVTVVSATDTGAKVARGEGFSLRPGESASIEGDALVVGFIRVTGDSRCPRGDQCVWEGDATLRIWIQPKGGDREEREISLSGKESSQAGGASYEVRLLRLDPQPVSGHSTEQGNYVATLQVLPKRTP